MERKTENKIENLQQDRKKKTFKPTRKRIIPNKRFKPKTTIKSRITQISVKGVEKRATKNCQRASDL